MYCDARRVYVISYRIYNKYPSPFEKKCSMVQKISISAWHEINKNSTKKSQEFDAEE